MKKIILTTITIIMLSINGFATTIENPIESSNIKTVEEVDVYTCCLNFEGNWICSQGSTAQQACARANEIVFAMDQ